MNKKLIEAVKVEAKNLKKFAPKNNLKNLDLSTLEPSSPSRCIYGQMMGNCFNLESNELMKKCTKIFIKDANLGGKKFVKEISEYHHSITRSNSSPIEVFLNTSTTEQNKKLIDYLKGKTKRLNLK